MEQNKSLNLEDILNDKNNDGESLLYLAIAAGHDQACKLLIEKGASVNLCKSSNWMSPLHLAASTARNVNIVKLLVDNGAKVTCTDVMKETPLHKAARNNKVEVVDYLLDLRSVIHVFFFVVLR